MNNEEKIYDVNIENTNIIPVPEETRKLNKKLIKEDPLTPYKKSGENKIIAFVILFIFIVAFITAVIYKFVIAK